MTLNKKFLTSLGVIIIAFAVLSIGLNFTGVFLLNNNDLVIGIQTILTGPVAIYGEYAQQGIELALEEINANGGINGKQIKLIYEDDQADPVLAVSAIETLLTRNPKAILSYSGSGATLAITPILEERKIPTVIGLASNSKIKDEGDYIFRVIPSDAFQSIQWIDKVKNYKKPAMLSINNSWGKGLEETFLKNYSGEVFVESMGEGTKDVKAQLLKIKNYGPDVLILTCYIQECITTLKQMEELNINTPIISADVFYNQEILDAVPEKAEGVIMTRPKDGVGKEWEQFKEKFIVKYKKEPNIMHAYAYDSMYTLYYSLKNSDLTSEGIKDALSRVDFVGVTGRNKFDEFGEVNKSFQWTIVKNGKFEDYN